MKFKIKWRYIVLFLLIALCYGGWYFAENYISINIPEDVTNYCNSKYSINSKWIKYINEENTENSRVSLVDDGTGIVFKVNRYYDEDNKLHYKDDYLGYKFESEIEKLLSESIPQQYKYTLSIENSNFPNVKDGSINVVDFCRNSETVLCINFLSDSYFSKDDMYDIVSSLRGKVRVSAYVDVKGISNAQHFASDEDYNLIVR